MNILEVRNLHFSYPMQEVESLCGVNISFEEGKFYIICGRSGSGKSTLLKHLKAELAPHGRREGEVLYAGNRMEEIPASVLCSEIGYVFQNPDVQIVTDKVWHELAFGLESLGYDSETIHLRVAEMASYFGIQNWFWKNVSELSGGQKQMLNLASVMVMHPKVLLLDEPTSQLDPIAASEFLHTVHRINQELGVTVVLTEHRLEDAISWADSVVVMEKGKVFAKGSAAEIGSELQKDGNPMFQSMPAPMRIYAATESLQECPYTVAMGRMWLSEELKQVNLTENREEVKQQDGLQTECGKSARKRKKTEQASDAIIRAKDIWFRYDRDLPDVVQGLSLAIKRGEIFALMGGNGAGKSTTLRMLAGFLKPHRGTILLDGKPVSKYTEEELYQGMLGVLPQDPTNIFVNKTVREELSGADSEEKVREMVDFLGITELLERHPYDLSGGEQQKVALGKLLLRRPQILLLDEPTKGLDSYFKKELGDLLQHLAQQGITILMVSHDIEFCAEYATRAGLFFEGKITSSKECREFFAGNHFYTTAANRMAREFFKTAVTVEDVVESLQLAGVPMRGSCQEMRFLGKGDAEEKVVKLWSCQEVQEAVLTGIETDQTETRTQQKKYSMAGRKASDTRTRVHKIVVIAVLVALGVAGRAAFYMVPSIKPIAAITIVAAASLGAGAGGLVGALSMLASNMLFGQGPWTIWQMLSMGLIGLLAGFLFYGRKKLWKRRFLCIYGFLSVVICYGMVMNTASLLMTSYELNTQNLKAMYLSGLPVDLVHALSTVVFLMILGKPMLEQLERVKKKML